MSKRSSSFEKGYTVLELLIYVILFAGISIFVVLTFAGFAKAWGASRTQRALFRGGSDATERLLREIRFAKGIRRSESTFDATPGVLALDTFIDPSSDTLTTITFLVQNNQLMVQPGAQTPQPLTASNVRVDSFKVWEVSPFKTASTTSIELVLTAGAGTSFQRSATFTATGVLRGSYKK